MNDSLVQLEHAGKNVETQRVIDAAVREQVSTQTFLLDLLLYHLTHVVRVVEQVPHLHRNAEIYRLSEPVGFNVPINTL